MQQHKSVRDAFLHMPRELDGTVRREVLEQHLGKIAPKEGVQSLLQRLPPGTSALTEISARGFRVFQAYQPVHY
jgi:hypothetical protein